MANFYDGSLAQRPNGVRSQFERSYHERKVHNRYLGSYLGKQHRTAWLKGQRLWAAFGDFNNCRVKDIEVDSDFTRAVKFCQAELGRVKLPFWFTHELLLAATDEPARLKLACNIARKGQYIADVRRVLTTY